MGELLQAAAQRHRRLRRDLVEVALQGRGPGRQLHPGRDEPAGNFIPGSPNRTASAGVTYAEGPWSGGLRLRYFGPRPLIEDNSERSGSSTLVNAKIGYALTKQVRMRLDVLNLFDRKVDDITYFYTSRLQGEPAEGVADKHFHPAEPRTFRVSLMLQM